MEPHEQVPNPSGTAVSSSPLGSLGTVAFACVPSLVVGGQRCLGGQVGEGVGGTSGKELDGHLSGESPGRGILAQLWSLPPHSLFGRSTGEVGAAVPAAPLDI